MLVMKDLIVDPNASGEVVDHIMANEEHIFRAEPRLIALNLLCGHDDLITSQLKTSTLKVQEAMQRASDKDNQNMKGELPHSEFIANVGEVLEKIYELDP